MFPCVVRNLSLALLLRFWWLFLWNVFLILRIQHVLVPVLLLLDLFDWGFATFVWMSLSFPSAGKGKLSLVSLFWVCVRTGYPPGIISRWVAMLGTFCNLSSLESLCWSGVSLCSEKSFFGSFVKVLVAFLVECVLDLVHSTYFGSSSFASWPVWLGIWHVCLGEPKFSFCWERQIQPGFTILGVCENWIPPWNNFTVGGYAWNVLQPLVSRVFV